MRIALLSLAVLISACSEATEPSDTDDGPAGSGGGAGTGGAGAANVSGGSSSGGALATGGKAGAAGSGGAIASGGTAGGAGSGGSGPDVGPGPDYEPGVWTNITPSIIPATSNSYCVTVDPGNPDNIYYCAPNPDPPQGGLFKSTDAGATWTKLPTLDTPLHVLVDPNDSDHLYAVDGVWGGTAGFWVSTDGGASFTKPDGFASVATGSVGTHDTYDIAADPADFQHIIITFHSFGGLGPNVMESTDGGTSFSAHTAPAGGYGHSIHFLHEPALGLGDANTWLLGTQGSGFWRTTNAGDSWNKVSETQITHGGNFICYSSTGALYSGGYQYISRSTDNGNSWAQVTSGLPYSWYMGVLCDGENLWTHSVSGGSFFVSPDSDGTTWTAYDGGTQTGFASGMFWGSFDAQRRILYVAPGGSTIHELWALKLEE